MCACLVCLRTTGSNFLYVLICTFRVACQQRGQVRSAGRLRHFVSGFGLSLLPGAGWHYRALDRRRQSGPALLRRQAAAAAPAARRGSWSATRLPQYVRLPCRAPAATTPPVPVPRPQSQSQSQPAPAAPVSGVLRGHHRLGRQLSELHRLPERPVSDRLLLSGQRRGVPSKRYFPNTSAGCSWHQHCQATQRRRQRPAAATGR